jgi:predicted glutamine amidotransferase
MCRMVAVHANLSTRMTGSMLSAPHSLVTQSCSDAEEGLCHQDGWGIGYYEDGQPRRVRSAKAALGDPRYQECAESLVSPTLLAHVRRASAGSVAEQNSHPFVHGRWMFAHNGDMVGFSFGRERLLALLPERWRRGIEGDTDSEHAFRLVLARLERAAGSLDQPVDARFAAEEMAAAIRHLADLFPGDGTELSKFNFLLTDGRILLASRWGHSLSWLERRTAEAPIADGPVERRAVYHALIVASEPTSPEPWTELPERSLLYVNPDLTHAILPIAS